MSADSSKTWLQITVAIIGAFGAFLGGYATRQETSKDDEPKDAVIIYKKRIASLTSQYDSLSYVTSTLYRENQRYKKALQSCQDAAKMTVSPSSDKSGLPSKVVRNALIAPDEGLVGDRLDGTVVFKFQISTDEQQDNIYLQPSQTVLVGDDGNSYSANYSQLGNKQAEVDTRYSRQQVIIYREAPINAEFRFQVPTTLSQARALNLYISGKNILYSNVKIKWK